MMAHTNVAGYYFLSLLLAMIFAVVEKEILIHSANPQTWIVVRIIVKQLIRICVIGQ